MCTPDFDTVILAGGRARRMGGADKPALIVGNEPMVVSVARAAAAAGTRRLIVVGPRREGPVLDALTAVAGGARGGLRAGVPGELRGGGPTGVPCGLRFVREEPPGAGPVAALRSGVAEVTAPWLALLAADLPFLIGGQLTDLLGRAVAAGRAGAVLADAEGRPQWLTGGWQADVLRTALQVYHGNSLHGLLAPLEPVAVQSAGRDEGFAPWLDCDTPDDLTAARQSWQFRALERSERHDDTGQLDRRGLREAGH